MENKIIYKKKILMYYAVYTAFCEIISLVAIGPNLKFLIGLILGMIAVLLNLCLLEKVIDIAMLGGKIGVAFLLQLGRLLIYGIIGYLCLKMSIAAVIAFAIGAVGFTVSAVCTFVKGGKHGQLR